METLQKRYSIYLLEKNEWQFTFFQLSFLHKEMKHGLILCWTLQISVSFLDKNMYENGRMEMMKCPSKKNLIISVRSSLCNRGYWSAVNRFQALWSEPIWILKCRFGIGKPLQNGERDSVKEDGPRTGRFNSLKQ